MYLKRLDLVGFKSFARPTTFQFEPGISVLCGPNGSGKSNVSDAVRWALGEQSARAIRGRRGEDVIFVGSQGRQPLGLGEVSLTLDNSDGRIPLDYQEVRITRRLYRSGDAEYLANGSRVRLKDIHGWLLAAALDPDAYVVVGQGSVDELILQRAEERRTVIDNAADIRRHQVKLAETRSKLAATEENLLRCRAVIAELEPHVKRLRSQAERAERYRACREELTTLAARWFGHAVALARTEEVQAGTRAAEARAEVERLDRALAELEESVRLADARAEQAEDELGREEPRLLALRAEQARLAGELAVAEERRRAAAAAAATLRRDSDALGARRAALAGEALDLEGRVAAGRRELAVAEAELGASGADEDRGRLAEAEAELALLRRRAAEAGAARQSARVALGEGRARQERAERRRERATAELAALEPRLVAAGQQAVALAERAKRLGAGAAELRRRRDDLATEREAARRLVDARRAEQLTLAAERQRVEGRRALADEAAGYGARGAGPAIGTELGGVRGLLGGELRVPGHLQAAVSAALGESAGAVLVESADGAYAGLRLLHDHDAPRTGIVPLNGVPEAPSADVALRFKVLARPLLADLPLAGFADDLVAADSALDGVRARHLALVVLAPHLESALEAARRLSRSEVASLPWQVVTTDGQAIRWNGEWRAGRDRAAERLVARRDELARLDAELRRLDAALEDASRALAVAEQRSTALTADEADTRANLSGAETAEREAILAARAAADEAARLDREAAAARAALPDAEADLARSAEQARELAARLEAAERRWAAATSSLQEAEARVAELRASWEALRIARVERTALVATRRSNLEGQEALLGRLRRELAAAEQAIADAGRRLRADQEQEQAQAALARELDAARADAEARLGPLEESVAALRGQRRRASEERAAFERRAAELRASVRAQRTVLEAQSIAATRASDRLERLRREADEYFEEFDPPPSHDPAPSHDRPPCHSERSEGSRSLSPGPGILRSAQKDGFPDSHFPDSQLPLPDPEAVRRRMNALRRELRAIGPVGESTVAEFDELRERHAFLTTQTRDLEATVAELRGAMLELERMMRGAFDDAFARVNAAFGEYFARLFGGGHAELVLNRPEDVLETGVEIVARPPGKRLQALVSLSGGERALTMVALIFGLLRTNPAPFCVLDEVDAALDDANVRRFTDMLEELREQTQFIVVTHNRGTMEIAQALYGISMDTSGVSTVVSLRLPNERGR